MTILIGKSFDSAWQISLIVEREFQIVAKPFKSLTPTGSLVDSVIF